MSQYSFTRSNRICFLSALFFCFLQAFYIASKGLSTSWINDLDAFQIETNVDDDYIKSDVYEEDKGDEKNTEKVNGSKDEGNQDVENTLKAIASNFTEESTNKEEKQTIVVNKNNAESLLNNTSSREDVKIYDKVVIVTKVLWPNDLDLLQRMLCYLSFFYNDKRRYDIVVFTTLPWTEDQVQQLQKTVHPAKLVVAIDSPPIEEVTAKMTPEELKFINTRCGVKSNETLSWWHHCRDPFAKGMGANNLGYCWQAEFRTYHIWTHEALKDYKYMIWMDSDTRVANMWDGDNDPMKHMVEKDLNLLYSGFPYGRLRERRDVLKQKMIKVYNKTLCDVAMNKDPKSPYKGRLEPYFCEEIPRPLMIAGASHITNLDHYRKPMHQQFLWELVSDYKFSRVFDDQLAVTIPAVIENDGKAYHQISIGLQLRIGHHGMFDSSGATRKIFKRNKRDFFMELLPQYPALQDRCRKYAF